MKLSEKRARDFVLGILVVLCTYLLVGCDGGAGGTDVDGGADAGVHADTGHTDTTPATNPCLGSNVVVVTTSSSGASPADEIKSLCVGKALEHNFSSHSDCTSFYNSRLQLWSWAVADAECSHVMTVAECSDVMHDYIDSVGIKHGLVLSTDNGITGFGMLLDESGQGITTRAVCTAKGSSGIFLGKVQSW